MTFEEFCSAGEPPEVSVPLQALWFDAKGDWERAHGLVDAMETQEGMAVHAYLHRKHGDSSNSEYWYARCGRGFWREDLKDEWRALVTELLARS